MAATDIASLGIEVTSDSVTAAAQRLNAMSQSAAQASAATEQFAQQMVSSGANVQTLTTALNNLTIAGQGSTVAANALRQSIATLNTQAATGAGATNQLQGQLAALQGQLATAQQGAQGFGLSLGSLRQGLLTVRSAMLAFTVVGAGLFEVGKLAYDYDEAMNKIIALTDTGKDHVAQLNAEIRNISLSTGVGQTDLAKGFYEIASGGQSGAQALATLNEVAKASEIGLGSTTDVAHFAAAAMNAYGANIVTAERALDTLTQTTRIGLVAPNELASAMERVFPIAARAGVSIDQVSGAMASMTRNGQTAERSATALIATINAIEKPSESARKSLEFASEGKLNFQELADELKKPGGLENVIEELNTAFGKNYEQLARIFPNLRALTGIAGTTGSSMAQTKQIFDETTHSTGALDDGVKKIAGSASDDFNKAWAGLQDQLKETGNQVLPLVTEAFKGLNYQINPPSAPNLIGYLDQIKTKLLDAAAAIPGIAGAADILERFNNFSNAHQVNVDPDTGKLSYGTGGPAGNPNAGKGFGDVRNVLPGDGAGRSVGLGTPTTASGSALPKLGAFDPNAAIGAQLQEMVDKQKQLNTATAGGAEALGLYQARLKINTELEKEGITETADNRDVIESKVAALGHAIAAMKEYKDASKVDKEYEKLLSGEQGRVDIQNALNDAMLQGKDAMDQVRVRFQALNELATINLPLTQSQINNYLNLANQLADAKDKADLLTDSMKNENEILKVYQDTVAPHNEKYDALSQLHDQFQDNPEQFGVNPGLDPASYVGNLTAIGQSMDQLTNPSKTIEQKHWGDQFITQLGQISTGAITATGGVKSMTQVFGDMAQGLEKAIIQLLIINPLLNQLQSTLNQHFPGTFSNPGTNAQGGTGTGFSGLGSGLSSIWYSLFGYGGGGAGTTPAITAGGPDGPAFADGDVFGGPRVFRHSGSKIGVMGEAGPEAAMPLTRMPGGQLGVRSESHTQGATTVNIHNYTSGKADKATVNDTRNNSGGRTIDVQLSEMNARDTHSNGPNSRAIQQQFGLTNQVVRR